MTSDVVTIRRCSSKYFGFLYLPNPSAMIPGFIITWITFPGVIVHEFAHMLFCKLTGTHVVEVCYFSFGNPAGYVLHETPSNTWKHILIEMGPFLVNTLVGFCLGLLCIPIAKLNASSDIGPFLQILSMWLAISVAMHSFPSITDARSIWAAIWKAPSPFLAKLIGTPLVAIIFIGAIGSVFWLDAVYGAAVVVGLPILLHIN